MRNRQDGKSFEVFLQMQQGFVHFFFRLVVESRGSLVEQEQIGLFVERPGYAYALFLSA